jgi:Mg-chelatase subunit ChlI
MSRRERRPPSRNREQRDVDRTEIVHARKEVGVTGEVDAAGTAHDEAEGLCAQAERAPRRVVVRVDRANAKRAELELVPLVDLDDVMEAAAAQKGPRAARNDHANRPVEPRERRQVKVIEVAVRDEDRVDIGECGPRDGSGPPQVHHGSAQHRIREQARSIEAHDDGAVAKPGERILRRYADSSTRRFIPVG